MVIDENNAGKGMDRMSLWQQHYYTWSTKSLSGNKVGLGIVAASDKDRDYLRIVGTEASKCEACRDKEHFMIERMSYSSELHGFIRTGTIPCEQGADQRNNQFVHIQSSIWNSFAYPEDYLCPLSYKEKWEGEEKLVPLSISEKKMGRARAIGILKKYQMESRLSSLFYHVYHCMLTSEKPLLFVDRERNPEEFAGFSREMMILIHYMIPEHLRKEADYISYITEKNQEAHFLFGNEAMESHCFFMNEPERKKEYTLLEREFYDWLAELFLKNNEEFDQTLKNIEEILTGLSDRRNQLEKCILSLMSPYAGREKRKDNYFTSMERLMYWARKDESLLAPLKESISSLDFHDMEEEELLSYTKLLLTGAGGKTKEIVFLELNRMLFYFREEDRKRFKSLVEYIREKHGAMYETILKSNRKEEAFLRDILFMPVRNVHQLEQVVQHHSGFFGMKEYKKYLVTRAYEMYRQTKEEKTREYVGQLGKQVDEDAFVELKWTDVREVVNQAETLEEFLALTEQMNLSVLETTIQEHLYIKSIYYLKKKEALSGMEEGKLQNFAAKMKKSGELEEELISYYGKIWQNQTNKKTPEELVSFSGSEAQETRLYQFAKNRVLAERYREWMRENGTRFLELPMKDWIQFVLRVTENIGGREKKLAKGMIQDTKKTILATEDLLVLAEANYTLRSHGSALIHCTEAMWDHVQLEDAEDLERFFHQVPDLSLLRCDSHPVYKKIEEMYEYADSYRGKPEERAFYAWRKYEKRHRQEEKLAKEGGTLKMMVNYAVWDILSKSIWAVFLGYYGWLFVTIREKVAIMPGYLPSIILLVVLLLCYGYKGFRGKKREETPGAVVYVLGVGILLMNWGLALDTLGGVGALYGVSMLLATVAKIFSFVLKNGQRKTEDGSEEETKG